MRAYVRARTNICQSSESIVVLARVRAHKNVRTRTYQIMRAYERLSYHAKTLYVGHIFQSSERIVVLAHASTDQIKGAYVRLSNHTKALVCVRAHIFQSSESIVVLARARVLRKKPRRARTKSCAHMCVRTPTFAIFRKHWCACARVCFKK
jgi:hypothetical protein